MRSIRRHSAFSIVAILVGFRRTYVGFSGGGVLSRIRYSVSVLKVPLNTNQPTNQPIETVV